MALIVEDGTGLSTAESYISVANADTYHTKYGAPTTWSALVTASKEQALRLATRYLDAVYHDVWHGRRYFREQALDWPRSDMYDRDGYNVLINELPRQLIEATAIMALKSVSEELIPDIDNPGTIEARMVKIGEIAKSEKFMGGRSQIKRYRLVDLMLQQFISHQGMVQRG